MPLPRWVRRPSTETGGRRAIASGGQAAAGGKTRKLTWHSRVERLEEAESRDHNAGAVPGSTATPRPAPSRRKSSRRLWDLQTGGTWPRRQGKPSDKVSGPET